MLGGYSPSYLLYLQPFIMLYMPQLMRFLILLLMGLVPIPLFAQFLSVDFQSSITENEVEVYVEGQLFTKLIYADTLAKYVLYPLYTASGIEVTRGYPISPRPGESTDHPHQVGFWFTFGDVNGIDFWNSHSGSSTEEQSKYGMIRLTEPPLTDIVHASITVHADWLDPRGNILLKERSVFHFDGSSDTRTIRRETRLTAHDDDIRMNGNKEGLIGVRVDKDLESANGGRYLNSNGDKGDAVWGKRASWVSLTGKKEQRDITLTFYDVPGNPNYPAWAHARGYGLFALNNLGGQEFDANEKEEVNLVLKKGESVNFMHILTLEESRLP